MHHQKDYTADHSVIPDKNLFMKCDALHPAALSALPSAYHIRKLREDEFSKWKAMHIDNPQEADEYDRALTSFYEAIYAPHENRFFEKCLVMCDADDKLIATCFIWEAYKGKISTLHWLKVLKAYEDRGLGRAMLSHVMQNVPAQGYPVFLHTHPSCYRAIKLYADFGFKFLTDPTIGNRTNDYVECIPILRRVMGEAHFSSLESTTAPPDFLAIMRASSVDEF